MRGRKWGEIWGERGIGIKGTFLYRGRKASEKGGMWRKRD